MKQLFLDKHIDNIMTFLKEINLFNKNLISLFLKWYIVLTFIIAFNMLKMKSFGLLKQNLLNLVEITLSYYTYIFLHPNYVYFKTEANDP